MFRPKTRTGTNRKLDAQNWRALVRRDEKSVAWKRLYVVVVVYNTKKVGFVKYISFKAQCI